MTETTKHSFMHALDSLEKKHGILFDADMRDRIRADDGVLSCSNKIHTALMAKLAEKEKLGE